jgi:hypothetical protein
MVELVNFVLMAAGAKKKWVASDVDLEALEPEELDILLAEMMKTLSESEHSKNYPLSEKKGNSKAKNLFRGKFQDFWVKWVERALALPSEAKKAPGLDMLRMAIDQLVSLSSMSVVNIRDAVTEAALSVARGLLAHCASAKNELETATRQLSAEEARTSKAVARQNPKYLACVKQKDMAYRTLEGLQEFVNAIFNSILVHRTKDFSELVRATAVRHLGMYTYIHTYIYTYIHTSFLLTLSL